MFQYKITQCEPYSRQRKYCNKKKILMHRRINISSHQRMHPSADTAAGTVKPGDFIKYAAGWYECVLRYYKYNQHTRNNKYNISSRAPSPFTGHIFYIRGIPSESASFLVAIRIMSTSHHIPHPPNVKSFRRPSPTYPR